MQRIRNVRIVDVASGSTSPPSSVVLGSGRIRSILGPGEPLADGLDAGGRFLAPGLIDSHVHFFFDCGASPRTSFEATAVEAAHGHGVQVAAHCHATESIARSVEERVDTIEHVSFVAPPGRYRYDPHLARRVCDAGVAVSPTVTAALRTARRFRESGTPH